MDGFGGRAQPTGCSGLDLLTDPASSQVWQPSPTPPPSRPSWWGCPDMPPPPRLSQQKGPKLPRLVSPAPHWSALHAVDAVDALPETLGLQH